MAYVDDNLMPGERVTARARLHWVLFVPPASCLVAGLGLLLWSWAARTGGPVPAEWTPVIIATGAFVALAAALTLASRLVVYLTSEFAVTNRRIVAKTGFIQRHTIEILLFKIEAIHLNQSVLGRLIGFGSIAVTGTGGAREPFRRIARPLAFRTAIQEQAAAAQTAAGPAAS
jgi:uncharacterized membrane protein YdbT with pleckstrin-like domain